MTVRIVAGIEYEGTNYFGWQKQQNVVSVQATLENALSKIANHEINIFCAGRTDAGVHALGQVIHFDTEATRPEAAWVLGVNCNLPRDIRIHWAKEINDNFHARFSATARSYQYLIYIGNVYPALLRHRAAWLPHNLDENLMQEAAQYLLGEHDFSAFRGIHCQSKSTKRNVEKIEIKRIGCLITINIKANAFLRHMVRNIIGALVEVGLKKKEPLWIQKILFAKDRNLAGVTMPPQGLYFMKVDYSPEFLIPIQNKINELQIS